MSIDQLNQLDKSDLVRQLQTCCSSEQWSLSLAESAPFRDLPDLLEKSTRCWSRVSQAELMSALKGHPPIGVLKKGFSEEEQRQVQGSDHHILEALKDKNEQYQKQFGFVFLICATGKSGAEILRSLNSRLENSKETELAIASAQLNEINNIRLTKLTDSM